MTEPTKPTDRADRAGHPQQLHTVPLAALSFAAFVYVAFEMFSIGLISPMARDLGVSEGRIGLLMTVYAGLVAVVTIPLMAATRHVNRRPLFLATLGFLLAGIVLQATAPNYFVLVAGRVTAAFTHGLFWSIVNPMATRLAPLGQMGRAVAVVSLGSTMSTVVGAPLTTGIGNAIGWRGATWVLRCRHHRCAAVGAAHTAVDACPCHETSTRWRGEQVGDTVFGVLSRLCGHGSVCHVYVPGVAD